MKSKNKVGKMKTESAVVLLGRLPKWISEQKTVKVVSKHQELIITSLPSSPTYYEYRSMNNSFMNNFSNTSSMELEGAKRLTRSTGGKLDVDFNAKLPDDRNYKCNILGSCSYPFLGFESCHHAISLSNNEVFQFLSNVEDKMDLVLEMVMTDIDCSSEEVKESVPLKKQHRPAVSRERGRLVKNMKKIKKKKKSLGKDSIQKNDVSEASGQLSGGHDCGKDFCRLGCMCESLKAKRKRTHCGHVECMFSRKCLGPISVPCDYNKLTLLGQPINSPEGIPVKRIRKPPKRWLEEEEELEDMAEAKRRSKVNAQAIPSPLKVKGVDEVNVLERELGVTGGNGKCLEHNLMNCPCSYIERACLPPKRTFNMAIKSTSGKFSQKLKNNMNGGISLVDNSFTVNLSRGNTVISPGGVTSIYLNTSPTEPFKPGMSGESIAQAVISRKYFRNYKEYRKMLTSPEVSEPELELMCSRFLSPLISNSIILMKWSDLEEKVRLGSAYLWLSQAPKCIAKVFVSESEIPPDANSINFIYVENVCNIQSSIDYLFQLPKKQPERFGCCILSCQELYWEVKGNLNMKTKFCDKILFKVLRSFSKGLKELTFANSGKKILICESGSRQNEDALYDNYVPDDDMESEINEIPEPDIHLFDSSRTHYVEKFGSPASLDPQNASVDAKEPRMAYPGKIYTRIIQPLSSSRIAVAPARNLLELNWYCLNLDKSFDKIIIDKPNFTATYSQMLYALQLSHERSIAVRISCPNGSNYMFNHRIWRQGVYADYSLSEVAVKIGPYYSYEVPEIRAFVKINGIFCRTYVQLTKEPLNKNYMPRVSNKENSIAPERKSNEFSFGHPKLQAHVVATGKVESDCQQPLSSCVNGSLSQASISCGISNRSTSVSGTIEFGKNDLKEEIPEPSTSEADFSFKIESVLGNWSGFNDMVNSTLPVTKNNVIAKKSVDSTKLHVDCEESGYLVSEVPNIMAIAVTKGGNSPKNSKSIQIVDTSWATENKPLIFKNEEAASFYIRTCTKVKFYPDDFKNKWTFMKDSAYYRYYVEKNVSNYYNIRKLTEDQFITANGIFKYDDVCTDNLAQYGLKTVDNRRLLEFRRRREIRDAKNELNSLLPKPEPDVLVKVIHESRLLIRSLEEKGNSLLEEIIAENERKSHLLAELRLKCTGEEMYQIFEQLEKIPRPRTDESLDYDSVYGSVNPRKRRRPVAKKSIAPSKGKSSAPSSSSSSNDARELPELVPSEEPANPTLKCRSVLKKLEPPVTLLRKVRGPLREGKTASSSVAKEPPKTRNLFSGRYVSAATKRSLRKYNYIIPCLERKNSKRLKNKSVEVCGNESEKQPLPSTVEGVTFGEGGETDLDAEMSVDITTDVIIVKEEPLIDLEEYQESETNHEMTEEQMLWKSGTLQDNGAIAENTVKVADSQESHPTNPEIDADLSSLDSFIDVGTKDDLLPMCASTDTVL